jgi:predicted CXXCH cytochrome family protein
MTPRKNSNLTYTISVLILLLFIGCSVEKQHKYLVMFFDGVDNVVVAGPTISRDSLSRDAMAKRDNLMQKIRPDKYTHKPYKERQCLNCHKQDERATVKNLPELLAPLPDLCFKCHKDFRQTYKYVHGPVAAGGCLKCHNQHYSSYPKLLTREGQQICTTCHLPSDVFKNRFHRNIEDVECTTCHNPHGSDRRYMLRESIAKFGGLDMAGKFAARRLSGQIYIKSPGDLGAGIPVDILDEKNQVVATTQTDSTGRFSLENMHPNNDYSFKFHLDSPSARINVYDNSRNLLTVIDRGRKGRYNFDKDTYERTHRLADGKAAAQLAAETAVAKTEPEAPTAPKQEPTPSEADTSKPIAAAEPTPAPEPVSAATTTPTAPADTVTPATTTAVTEPTPTATTTEPPTAKLPDLGGAVSVTNYQDVANVKLSGKTFHFTKGTVVCVLDDFGGVVAIAKVDGSGNFVMDKPNAGEDTSVYSQIIFLNSNTNNTEGLKKPFRSGPAMSVGGIEGGPVARIDKLNNGQGEKNEALLTVVYYQYRSSELTDAGLDELDKVITFLDNNPDVSVNLNAYTDSRGSAGFNQKLSDKRAKAVRDYLVSQGIEASRVTAKGYGENNLVNKCADGVPCSDAEHAQNRRVEIFITDNSAGGVQK